MYAPHLRKDFWPSTYDLACIRSTYSADRQWNWVLNLEPSGPEAETLPQGHRGLSLSSGIGGLRNIYAPHLRTSKESLRNDRPHLSDFNHLKITTLT
ncbi:hypothetical protein AVEN_102533-1 [Araneus ventricosus]|uniref:Uncharacterized protein n=1 Tax=Araneus ventricosus TaxID=182803 RepID=A0A4Y2BJN4_ARAVE|nr:hypothetical protein AVEN_102533-1 [Araneus ventricosus]